LIACEFTVLLVNTCNKLVCLRYLAGTHVICML
jgi:hypothetical protein